MQFSLLRLEGSLIIYIYEFTVPMTLLKRDAKYPEDGKTNY